jgi:hypothetical protein
MSAARKAQQAAKKAQQVYEAALRSGWDKYHTAIKAAYPGDIGVRMDEMERAWEKSNHTDLYTLLGALVFSAHLLPAWLFKGLRDQLKASLQQQQQADRSLIHWVRWFFALQAHREGLPWEGNKGAYQAASKQLADTPFEGARSTVKKSYLAVQRIRKTGTTLPA